MSEVDGDDITAGAPDPGLLAGGSEGIVAGSETRRSTR